MKRFCACYELVLTEDDLGSPRLATHWVVVSKENCDL